MKKTLLMTMVLLLSLTVILPASATSGNANTKEGRWAKFVQTKAEYKERNGQKFNDEVRPKFEKNKEAKVLRGTLTTVGSDYVVVTAKEFNQKFKSKSPKKIVPEGEYTVKIDENTKLVRRFWGDTQLSEFSVGDNVHIIMKDDNGVYTAYLLKDQSTFLTRYHRIATVTDVDETNNTLTVQKGEKTGTISIDDDTRVKVEGTEATITDIEVGDKIAVKGVVNKNLQTVFADIIEVFTGKWKNWLK